jgi:hypothetical protein
MGLPLATTPPLVPLSARAKGRLLAEILGTYVRVRWLMLRRDLGETVAVLRGGSEPAADATMPFRNGWRLADAVARSLRLLPTDSRCLMRSLVLLAMLERRGVQASLVIGVKTDPKFAAHAWVERDGHPLLPSGNGEYSQLTAV